MSVTEQLSRKGVNLAVIVDQIIAKPDEIVELIGALKVEQRAVKFSYEKVLRQVIERRPELIYPCLGRPDVVFTTNPLSPVAELRSLGLEIQGRDVILVLEKAGVAAGHRQMGNVE